MDQKNCNRKEIRLRMKCQDHIWNRSQDRAKKSGPDFEICFASNFSEPSVPTSELLICCLYVKNMYLSELPGVGTDGSEKLEDLQSR